jgi:hypothetical protein
MSAERKAGRPPESASVLRARRLLNPSVSLEEMLAEFDRDRPTPQVTIEAILFGVRERGVAALEEPDTVERLARCDASAKTQIDKRIRRLLRAKDAAHV